MAIIALAAVITMALAPAGRSATTPISGLGQQDALLVVDPDGIVVVAHNPDKAMIPASTLKVLTSLAALHYLGANYRFPTEFTRVGQNDLGIRGYGDPLLISEVVAAIAHELATTLPAEMDDILIDERYFQGPLSIPGVSASTNPYDAPIGALCVNFNTVFFTHVQGRPRSAEDQTPLLPMILPRIRQSGLAKGRIVLSPERNEVPLYAGRLFRHFLEREGVSIHGKVTVAPQALSGTPLVYRHLSPYTLPQTIQRLLEFSNNFMANQLLLAMGAKQFGPPATLEKGVRALSLYARHVIGIEKCVLVEGSGISRHNRMTVREMDKILARFSPHADLMTRQGRERYKTGTLRGVRTRVGYIDLKPGERYRFALFRNRTGKSTVPVMRQIHRHLANSRN